MTFLGYSSGKQSSSRLAILRCSFQRRAAALVVAIRATPFFTRAQRQRSRYGGSCAGKTPNKKNGRLAAEIWKGGDGVILFV
jgi:hypothetical protein